MENYHPYIKFRIERNTLKFLDAKLFDNGIYETTLHRKSPTLPNYWLAKISKQ